MNDKTKPKNISIHRSPSILRVLENYPNLPPSGRISSVCDRYRHIVLSQLPQLTPNELALIGDSLQGKHLDTLSVDNLHTDIADVALADKVRLLTLAERYAVLEAVKL